MDFLLNNWAWFLAAIVVIFIGLAIGSRPPQHTKEEKLENWGWILFLSMLSAIITLIITLNFTKAYGYALYIGIPTTVGFVCGFISKTRHKHRFTKVVSISLIITVLLCVALMLAGVEGAICILMIFGPLFVLVLIGYIIGYGVRLFSLKRQNMVILSFFMINPACIISDTRAGMTDDKAIHSVIINAPASKVWGVITHPVSYNEHPNFFFRMGVNYPKQMQLITKDGKSYLHCELRNGSTDLFISKLETEKVMRFHPVEEILPMEELTFYDSLDAPHTHPEYFHLHFGEFRIQPINSNSCKLIARSDFAYKLTPAFYWSWWGHYLINKMHGQVLDKVKTLSEQN